MKGANLANDEEERECQSVGGRTYGHQFFVINFLDPTCNQLAHVTRMNQLQLLPSTPTKRHILPAEIGNLLW